jgi:hypothetical protein
MCHVVSEVYGKNSCDTLLGADPLCCTAAVGFVCTCPCNLSRTSPMLIVCMLC